MIVKGKPRRRNPLNPVIDKNSMRHMARKHLINSSNDGSPSTNLPSLSCMFQISSRLWQKLDLVFKKLSIVVSLPQWGFSTTSTIGNKSCSPLAMVCICERLHRCELWLSSNKSVPSRLSPIGSPYLNFCCGFLANSFHLGFLSAHSFIIVHLTQRSSNTADWNNCRGICLNIMWHISKWIFK